MQFLGLSLVTVGGPTVEARIESLARQSAAHDVSAPIEEDAMGPLAHVRRCGVGLRVLGMGVDQ